MGNVSKTENSEMGSGAIFTKHTIQPWPTSLASCVAIHSWLAACPGEVEQFEDYLSIKAA